MAKFGITRFLSFGPNLIRFFTRSNITFKSKLIVIIALLYILMPFDFVPDVMPIVGWIEDFIIGCLTFTYVNGKVNQKNEVKHYDDGNTITVDAKVIEEEKVK